MRKNNSPENAGSLVRRLVGRNLSRGIFPLWAIGVICVICGCPPAVRAQDDQAVFQRLIRDYADTVVSIKLVLKMKGGAFGADGQQFEQDTSGLMIDPAGIVLASSNEMGGVPPSLKPIIAQMGEMSIEPTDIKVLIGNDPTEYEAEIITRDSDLDLAWLRVKTTDDKRFTALDLTNSAECRLGQKLVVVDRVGKYFDRAPVAEAFRVAGIAEKPRHLYVPNTQLGSGFCTPIFTQDGKFIGVKVLQIPELDFSSNNPLASMTQMREIQAILTGFILPAETIRTATERAKTASQPAAPSSTESAKETEPAEEEAPSKE